MPHSSRLHPSGSFAWSSFVTLNPPGDALRHFPEPRMSRFPLPPSSTHSHTTSPRAFFVPAELVVRKFSSVDPSDWSGSLQIRLFALSMPSAGTASSRDCIPERQVCRLLGISLSLEVKQEGWCIWIWTQPYDCAGQVQVSQAKTRLRHEMLLLKRSRPGSAARRANWHRLVAGSIYLLEFPRFETGCCHHIKFLADVRAHGLCHYTSMLKACSVHRFASPSAIRESDVVRPGLGSEISPTRHLYCQG